MYSKLLTDPKFNNSSQMVYLIDCDIQLSDYLLFQVLKVFEMQSSLMPAELYISYFKRLHDGTHC